MKFINIKTILLIAIIIAFIEYNKTDDEMLLDVMLPPGTKVLAFGDSITHGYGVGKNDNYPSQLSKLLNASVINSGVSGEISKEGLRRLPGVLEKYKPNILILCHGGNDILRKKV